MTRIQAIPTGSYQLVSEQHDSGSDTVHRNYCSRAYCSSELLFTRHCSSGTVYAGTVHRIFCWEMGTKLNNTDCIGLLESDVTKMREEAESHQVEVAMQLQEILESIKDLKVERDKKKEE